MEGGESYQEGEESWGGMQEPCNLRPHMSGKNLAFYTNILYYYYFIPIVIENFGEI